jgi:hypothetical protein
MAPCVHCGSSGSQCDWVSPLDVIDADPPCRETVYYQAKAAEDGWRFFKAMLGVEAGVLTLVVLVALMNVQ